MSHLMECPSLTDNWKQIQLLVVETIKDFVRKNKIHTDMMLTVYNVFPELPSLCDEQPVICQLA